MLTSTFFQEVPAVGIINIRKRKLVWLERKSAMQWYPYKFKSREGKVELGVGEKVEGKKKYLSLQELPLVVE